MLVVQGDPRLAAHRKGPFRDLFWQRNELRSSFPEPIGSKTSFGVVKTPHGGLRLRIRRLLRLETGLIFSILLFLQQNLVANGKVHPPCTETITPKLVCLPS